MATIATPNRKVNLTLTARQVAWKGDRLLRHLPLQVRRQVVQVQEKTPNVFGKCHIISSVRRWNTLGDQRVEVQVGIKRDPVTQGPVPGIIVANKSSHYLYKLEATDCEYFRNCQKIRVTRDSRLDSHFWAQISRHSQPQGWKVISKPAELCYLLLKSFTSSTFSVHEIKQFSEMFPHNWIQESMKTQLKLLNFFHFLVFVNTFLHESSY